MEEKGIEEKYKEEARMAAKLIDEADCIYIAAGAGMGFINSFCSL